MTKFHLKPFFNYPYITESKLENYLIAIIHALTHVKDDPFTDVYEKKKSIVLNLLTKLAGDNSSEMSKRGIGKKLNS